MGKHLKTDFNLFENKKESSDTIILNKVSNFIKKRFKKRNNPIFLYWIAKVFELDNILLVSKIEMGEEPKDVIHSFIKIDDKYFDESGFYDKEDLIKKFDFNEYNFKDMTFKSNLEELKKVVDIQDFEISDKNMSELKTILQRLKD